MRFIHGRHASSGPACVMPSQQWERFWKRVMVRGDDDCWPWLNACDKRGYGKFQISLGGSANQKHVRAPRCALAFVLGDWPDGFALHSCDNPACVNPKHLRAGTQKENIRDMDDRGRRPSGFERPTIRGDAHWSRRHPEWRTRGERHGQAKLTDAQVADIRRRKAAGERTAALAAEYGVSRAHATMIVSGARR